MSFFPVNSGSPEFYPPGQKEGWPTFILRSLAPRGMPCPPAPISRGHGDGYSLGALLLPLAKQSPCMAGAEVTLSVAFWAVDMCVFRLMLPITSLLSAVLACLFCSVYLLQSPLTLSLTRAGLGLSCHSGKESQVWRV